MSKKWYGVHTYSGFENKVRLSLQERVKNLGLEEFFGEILIPSETVVELKKGEKKTSSRKFFPGYVLINLALYDDARNVVEPTWRFLKETAGVIGFIGGERPMPLSAAEVDAIVNQVAEKKEKVKPKVSFEPGETVKPTDGPFMSFNGTVDEVDPDRGKLKVSVAIFGRSAPVELEYWQVERAVNETP